jgi:GT2 family glycosyltransferase
MSAPTISVVIPTCRRLDLVRASVDVLLADSATREIVIVDTSPDGAAAAWAAQMQRRDPRIAWLRARGEPAGAARQAGLERARGDLVLFVDDDVVARPGLATGHAARARPAARVVVGPTPAVPPPDRASTAAERVYAREYERRLATYRDGADVLRNLWGGNFSVPRRLALEIGMARGASLPYHEDRDFGLRCLAAGVTAVVAPELEGSHHHRRSNAEGARDARRRGAAAILIAERHPDAVVADDPARGLGVAGRALLAVCRRRAGHAVVAAAAAATARVCQRLHRRAAEEAAYKLWRRIEEQQGQSEQRRARASSPSSSMSAQVRERLG